ncbi:hypothetical protein B0T10DRAFT_9952 [Thelonectria olida]|uniref:Uncharacterized protein n=1 Tax=Thelonectria olida TaxID=1576542 RepID=A0A9P8WLC0_9HYPO|nr:hypothetical protein B0T10DRAFT_9952 [Thelonectria olida]
MMSTNKHGNEGWKTGVTCFKALECSGRPWICNKMKVTCSRCFLSTEIYATNLHTGCINCMTLWTYLYYLMANYLEYLKLGQLVHLTWWQLYPSSISPLVLGLRVSMSYST